MATPPPRGTGPVCTSLARGSNMIPARMAPRRTSGVSRYVTAAATKRVRT